MNFEITPGAPESPVILHVPHGSRALTPEARQRILLDDAALSAELDHITDAHTGLIAARATATASRTPWVFANRLSRLVVDPERFPDDREEMHAVGMGAVYLRTSHGEPLRDNDSAHVEDLLARHYRPYATAMAGLVDARLAAVGHVVIIDVHSYPSHALPYELHATGNRPAVCLGVDSFHTPESLRDAAVRAFAEVGDLDVNTPFSGTYVPLDHYRRAADVSALMIEIRRDMYMAEPGGAPGNGVEPLVRALARLIDAVQS
ncbi:N-formylglutamate amidohydrolase [Herbihabitans rhizosphaerae]|uniref:N-formylglutamate amidohydrolase n=1 Tax=Herbihabitans rhizosphaerae TaxID=1872711 RepID=A0A4Q7L528_9PSEU|nr:N-formylglutamate amidohydrolase [Herbihabitans rhizosphaerae]RZS44748.1 N-formylglutamate amidohydrolase [Herbihabitans rhizosphaerae]